MALTFDELDSIAINEIGVELASARNLLNKSSSDFVLDLRTTRHHVNAIEAGDLRIFYGAPFYIDLLRRYAKALNFSENEILEFEKRVLGFVDDKSEGASDSNGIESPNTSLGMNHNSLDKLNKKVFSNVKIKRKKINIDPIESKILKEKIDRLLLLLFALIVIVTGLVFILPKKQVITNTKPKFLEQVVTDQNNTRNKFIPLNSNNKNETKQDTMAFKEKIDNFDPTYLSNYEQVNNLKIDKSEFLNENFDYTNKQIQDDNGSFERVRNEQDNTQIKLPSVSLYASENTWFWIRYADDSVNEFTVKADSITNILKYPIYLVIGKPEVVEMSINGSMVFIERNDPDRNLARYTRTELREMANKE